jgi:hypothetical protein
MTIALRFAAPFLIAAALATPVAAQTSDAAYCTQLVQLAQRYIGFAGMGSSRGRSPKTLWALDQCNTANAAEAITVLETVLQDNGFTLPRR